MQLHGSAVVNDPQRRMHPAELRELLLGFEKELREAGLAESAVSSYVDQSLRFIRWLEGDYRPRNAPGPDLGGVRGTGAWTSAELGAELDGYRRELSAAKLRPLAIQTYLASTGAFVRWLGGTYAPGGARRVSHEKAAVDELVASIATAAVEMHRGYTPDNRLPVPGWELTPLQELQFGDLRYEGPSVRVVVEIESAGGVGNLVKYWPLLGGPLDDKRFALIHLYSLSSKGDYIAHRQLWQFLLERMRADINRKHDWTAKLLTYGKNGDPLGLQHAAELVKGELAR